MDKTKYLSACEWDMVVGARRTGLGQELQRCWVFTQHYTVCIKNGPPPKEHPANLTQTRASVPVECFGHLVESMH